MMRDDICQGGLVHVGVGGECMIVSAFEPSARMAFMPRESIG